VKTLLQPSKNPLEILIEKQNPSFFNNFYQSLKCVFTRFSRFFIRFSSGFDHAWFSSGFHKVLTRFSPGFHQFFHQVFTRCSQGFHEGFHEGFHIGFHIAFLRRFLVELPHCFHIGCHAGCHQVVM